MAKELILTKEFESREVEIVVKKETTFEKLTQFYFEASELGITKANGYFTIFIK